MKVVLAYCDDLASLEPTITSLYNEGKYPDYIKRGSNGFGKEKKTVIVGNSSKTKVLKDGDNTISLCFFEVDEKDIIGDPSDEDYLPFLEAAGLQCLAYGTNRGGEDCPYYKVQQDPDALVLYEKFYPKRQPTDEEGDPVGDPVFNKGVELARG